MVRSKALLRLRSVACLWLGLILLGLMVKPAAARLVEEYLDSPALTGNLLGDPSRRAVTVYLPPQYDLEPERRFPVVYLLHGFKAKHKLWTAAGEQGLGLEEVVDGLIAQGRIPPLLIVMPDGSNAYGGSFYLNSVVTGQWEDFLWRDLVNFIDQKYRTIPQPAARGLAGHSMGGYGAIMVGMRHPAIFGAVYAFSPACLVFQEQFLNLQRDNLLAVVGLKDRERFPALDWRLQVVIAMGAAVAPNPQNPPWFFDLPLHRQDGQLVLAEDIWQQWLKSDPSLLAPALRENLARLRLAFDMGTADRLLPQSRQFHAILAELGISHQYEEYDGDHFSRLRERLQERGLPFLADSFKVMSISPAQSR